MLRGLGIITEITDPSLNSVVAVLYNVASKTFTSDDGTQLSPVVAAYLTGTKGVPQIGVGGPQSTYPESPAPPAGAGPVTANLATQPKPPSQPGFFQEAETWLMAGDHAMYVGLGGAAAALLLAIGVGRKKGRR